MYRIYLITNKVNGKVYVGETCSTLKHRFAQHAVPSYKHCIYLHNAIMKHGKENFSIELLMDNLTFEEADYWEDYYIVMFDSRNRKRGYNIREGGATIRHSPETIEKIKKVQGSPEARQRKKDLILNGQTTFGHNKKGEDHPVFGRKHTEEELQRMRGRQMSDEEKKKLSIRCSGENNHWAKYTLEIVIALKKEAQIWAGTRRDLAAKYNMPYATLNNILAGRRWKNVIV